jgi:hypothetical protein
MTEIEELTVDEVEEIVLKTEPTTLSDRGDKIWTRRMAVALFEALNDRLRALSSRTSNEAVVRVKPLEWDGNTVNVFGIGYHVWWYENGRCWLARYGTQSIGDGFSSADEAKAAAQSHFEAAIRSALVSGSAVPGEDGWKAVPEEATQELLRDASSKEAGDKQVLCYQNGEYYNAWLVLDPYEGGWIWMNEADSEPNPSHYRLLPAPPLSQTVGEERT